jgi:hypothetical protein
MLTVKRQLSLAPCKWPRFPAAEGDASRVALREGSQPLLEHGVSP